VACSVVVKPLVSFWAAWWLVGIAAWLSVRPYMFGVDIVFGAARMKQAMRGSNYQRKNNATSQNIPY